MFWSVNLLAFFKNQKTCDRTPPWCHTHIWLTLLPGWWPSARHSAALFICTPPPVQLCSRFNKASALAWSYETELFSEELRTFCWHSIRRGCSTRNQAAQQLKKTTLINRSKACSLSKIVRCTHAKRSEEFKHDFYRRTNIGFRS